VGFRGFLKEKMSHAVLGRAGRFAFFGGCFIGRVPGNRGCARVRGTGGSGFRSGPASRLGGAGGRRALVFLAK